MTMVHSENWHSCDLTETSRESGILHDNQYLVRLNQAEPVPESVTRDRHQRSSPEISRTSRIRLSGLGTDSLEHCGNLGIRLNLRRDAIETRSVALGSLLVLACVRPAKATCAQSQRGQLRF